MPVRETWRAFSFWRRMLILYRPNLELVANEKVACVTVGKTRLTLVPKGCAKDAVKYPSKTIIRSTHAQDAITRRNWLWFDETYAELQNFQ